MACGSGPLFECALAWRGPETSLAALVFAQDEEIVLRAWRVPSQIQLQSPPAARNAPINGERKMTT